MKILIADQHDLFREGIKFSFKANYKGPFEAVEVSSFEEAQTVLLEDKYFDVVLLDADLSTNLSLRKISQLKKKYRSLPIVLLSSGDEEVDVGSVIKTGVDGLIFKTVEAEEMFNLVNEVVAGKTVFPKIANKQEKTKPKKSVRSKEGNVLTPRQMDVLRLLVEGKSNRDIATDLDLAEGTVKIHVTAILRALKASNRTQAVIKAADFL